jgi:hypothetical protein
LAGLAISSLIIILDYFQELIPHSYFLRIVMKSSVESTAQVYYDIGNNLNEEDSVTHKVYESDDFRKFDFKLPLATIYFLRFDPLKTEGKFEIKSAQIINDQNKILKNINLNSITPLNQILMFKLRKEKNTLICLTTKNANDPILNLNVSYEIPWLSRLYYNYKFDEKHTLKLFLIVFILSFSAMIFACFDLDIPEID